MYTQRYRIVFSEFCFTLDIWIKNDPAQEESLALFADGIQKNIKSVIIQRIFDDL